MFQWPYVRTYNDLVYPLTDGGATIVMWCVGYTTARVSHMTESAQPHISTSVGRSLVFCICQSRVILCTLLKPFNLWDVTPPGLAAVYTTRPKRIQWQAVLDRWQFTASTVEGLCTMTSWRLIATLLTTGKSILSIHAADSIKNNWLQDVLAT